MSTTIDISFGTLRFSTSIGVYVYMYISECHCMSVTLLTPALLRVAIHPFVIPPTATGERVAPHLWSLSPTKDQITYLDLEEKLKKKKL